MSVRQNEKREAMGSSAASAAASANDSRTQVKASRIEVQTKVQAIAAIVLRYGLVLVIAWIGMMKFTSYEANGIKPLVAHSPFLGWMYGFLSVRRSPMGWEPSKSS